MLFQALWSFHAACLLPYFMGMSRLDNPCIPSKYIKMSSPLQHSIPPIPPDFGGEKEHGMANHGVAVLLAVLQETALGLYAARASATRAFCPPDRLMPRAPMKAPSPPAAGLIGAPGCPVQPLKDGDRTDRTTDNWMKLGVIMTIHNIYEMDSV